MRLSHLFPYLDQSNLSSKKLQEQEKQPYLLWVRIEQNVFKNILLENTQYKMIETYIFLSLRKCNHVSSQSGLGLVREVDSIMILN